MATSNWIIVICPFTIFANVWIPLPLFIQEISIVWYSRFHKRSEIREGETVGLLAHCSNKSPITYSVIISRSLHLCTFTTFPRLPTVNVSYTHVSFHPTPHRFQGVCFKILVPSPNALCVSIQGDYFQRPTIETPQNTVKLTVKFKWDT